jgi:hypothetical protein
MLVSLLTPELTHLAFLAAGALVTYLATAQSVDPRVRSVAKVIDEVEHDARVQAVLQALLGRTAGTPPAKP